MIHRFFFKHLPSRRSVAKLPKCSRDVGRNVRTKKLSSCDNNRMPDGLTSALMGGDCGRSVRFLSEFCKNKNKTDSEFQVVFGEVLLLGCKEYFYWRMMMIMTLIKAVFIVTAILVYQRVFLDGMPILQFYHLVPFPFPIEFHSTSHTATPPWRWKKPSERRKWCSCAPSCDDWKRWLGCPRWCCWDWKLRGSLRWWINEFFLKKK